MGKGNAEKLKKFFDADPSASHRASRNFNPNVTKWNGTPVNMRVFSKLDALNQGVLEERGETRQVPLGQPDCMNHPVRIVTEDQAVLNQALKMKSGAIDSMPLLNRDEAFSHNVTLPASVSFEAVPKSISMPEGVMTPFERRERLEFEVKHMQAERMAKKARASGARRVHIMRQQYPLGILGTDGPTNAESMVYKDIGASGRQKHERTTKAIENRRAFLARQNSSSEIFRQHELQAAARAQTTAGGPRHTNTHSRIFSNEKHAHNPLRAQHLRNNEQAGRPYNIVNGGRISYVPPNVKEQHIPRQAHPSLSIHGYLKR